MDAVLRAWVLGVAVQDPAPGPGPLVAPNLAAAALPDLAAGDLERQAPLPAVFGLLDSNRSICTDG